MITESTHMKIADCIKYFLTRVRPNDYIEKCSSQKGKTGVIIYHSNSNTYFSGVSTDVKKYFSRTIANFTATNDDLPAVVQSMIRDGGYFEFYFFQFHVRNQVEEELARAGVRRVRTPMGSQISKPLAIYELYSVVFGITRYVSCENTDDARAILKQANSSINRWLKSSSYAGGKGHEQLNYIFKFELMQSPAMIFKADNTIIRRKPLNSNTLLPKYFRSEVERLNIQALESFLGQINGIPKPAMAIPHPVGVVIN